MEYWTLVILFLIVIIIATVMLAFMKLPYRQMQYLKIKKSLDKDNVKLIKDEEDIEYLKWLLGKYAWYSKTWSINLTPLYQVRWNKAKRIFKKYNLDIDVLQYSEKEK